MGDWIYFGSIISFATIGVLILLRFFAENKLTGTWNPFLLRKREGGSSGLAATSPKSFRGISFRFAKFWEQLSPPVQLLLTMAAMVIVTRLFIFCTGYIAVFLFRNEAPGFFDILFWRWNKWDASHLIDIAEHFYVNRGEERFFIVFYPLYPLLVGLVNQVVRHSTISGYLVSWVSLTIGCCYLFRLTELDHGTKIAWETVKYLLIFPVSFFLGLVYSDSLFLALSVMTFYYLRKEKWWAAGICGGLAALTRNFGILLLIPALIEWVLAVEFFKKVRLRELRKLAVSLRDSLAFLLIPCGSFIYLAINRIVTGDWFRFLDYQKNHWHNEFGWFPANIQLILKNALEWTPAHRAAMWMPQFVAICLTVFLLFYIIRKVRLSYIAYAFTYLVVFTSTTFLISAPRYLLGLFPLFIALALLSRNRAIRAVLTFGSIMLLSLYTAAFILDKSVM